MADRYRVLYGVCGSCRSIVTRREVPVDSLSLRGALSDPSEWDSIVSQALIPFHVESSDLKPVTGHRPNCVAHA